jgi:rubrerythrin
MTDLVCPECKGEIGLGIAINPETEYGARYMLPVPLVNSETMIMIDVYKCKSCGYSCDDEYNLMEVEE